MCAWFRFKPYVPVAKRRADSAKQVEKLRKKGQNIQGVQIEGRKIATSFWGSGWCDHMESFSDFENRLPRGRTYVRNGSVCHLEIKEGVVEALVTGSELYKIRIEIKALPPGEWERVKEACAGRIGSILELLKGNLSKEVMEIVTDRRRGLFPQPGEMKFECSCPDWADMCKHVAAALYGVGHRLDQLPDLLFKLRGVDAQELVGDAMRIGLPAGADADAADALAESELGGIFGVEIEAQAPAAAPAPSRLTKAPPATKRADPRKVSKPAPKPLKAKPEPREAKPGPREAKPEPKTMVRPAPAVPKRSAKPSPAKRKTARPASKAKPAAPNPAAKPAPNPAPKPAAKPAPKPAPKMPKKRRAG